MTVLLTGQDDKRRQLSSPGVLGLFGAKPKRRFDPAVILLFPPDHELKNLTTKDTKMEFAKEHDMLFTVQEWLKERSDFTATELACGFHGQFVPDIVGIICNVNAVRDLSRRTPRSRSDIRKTIGQGDRPEIYHSDLFAIELKLRNFPEAYFQAKTYSQFGFRTYIAMPEGVYDGLPHIRREVMKYDEIGFIEVGETCRVRIEAVRRRGYSIEEEAQISERLIMRFKKELDKER